MEGEAVDHVVAGEGDGHGVGLGSADQTIAPYASRGEESDVGIEVGEYGVGDEVTQVGFCMSNGVFVAIEFGVGDEEGTLSQVVEGGAVDCVDYLEDVLGGLELREEGMTFDARDLGYYPRAGSVKDCEKEEGGV